MTTFRYSATNVSNTTISGTVEATDRQAALKTLQDQNLRPLLLKEQKEKSGTISLGGGRRVKPDTLVIFTRQLAAMVGAGVPLLRALNSLEGHSENKAMKTILEGVIRDVEAGKPLADALAKYPATFNSIYVNMVRAGEAAGILEDILNRLALQQEKSATLRKKIKSAMTYPMVLVVIMTIAFFGLMLFVIPQIGKIVQNLGGPDAKLPLLTIIMLGISHFIVHWWFILIPALGGGIFLLLKYIKTPAGRVIFHHFVLRLPGIKTIITKVVVARFARVFSALMGAGVPVLQSLEVTAHALGNVVFEEVLIGAIDKVKSGGSLSQVIEKSPLFPAIVSQMLAVGEETGQTDKVLVKVADFYEEEVDVAIDGLSSIIEPVMIVIMGTLVGLIAASVMLPIVGLANQIH